MKTMRMTKTTTISLPLPLYRQVIRVADAKGMTTSELFRETFRRYQREEREWEELFAYGRQKAKAAGITTEEEIERAVDAVRR